MRKKEKKETYSLEELIVFNNALYYVFFDLRHFQRKYRKFFKFSILSETNFGMHFKHSKHGIRVEVKPDGYFHVFSTKSTHLYEFNCITSREFIDKLIKHELF